MRGSNFSFVVAFLFCCSGCAEQPASSSPGQEVPPGSSQQQKPSRVSDITPRIAQPPEEVYSTPAAAFEFYAKAVKNERWEESVAMLTPRAQRLLLALGLRGARRRNEAEAFQPLIEKYRLASDLEKPTFGFDMWPHLEDPAPALIEYRRLHDPSQLKSTLEVKEIRLQGEDQAQVKTGNLPGEQGPDVGRTEKNFYLKRIEGRWYIDVAPILVEQPAENREIDSQKSP